MLSAPEEETGLQCTQQLQEVIWPWHATLEAALSLGRQAGKESHYDSEFFLSRPTSLLATVITVLRMLRAGEVSTSASCKREGEEEERRRRGGGEERRRRGEERTDIEVIS